MSDEIRCAGPVWEEIEKHCFSSSDREVGGVLVGTLSDGEATVLRSLPALAATSGSANVTFTHEVWEQVHEALDRDFPTERIVGWYHSHPGFGVFLSEYDRFAHTSFFSDPAMLALVIDPHSGEAGWFAMREGEPQEIATRTTERSGLRVGASAAAGSSTAARVGLVAAVAIGLAAAVAGFFVGASTSSRTVVRTRVVAAPATPAADLPLPAAPTPDPAATPPVPAAAVAPAQLDYRVRRGDSFWVLARSFYGDPHLWTALKAANPQHPGDALEIGEHLHVPTDLKDRG